MRAEVSTQVAWLRGVAERKVAALAPGGRLVRVEVRVGSGLMQGAVQTYETTDLRIGSDPDSDVVLLDDGILPHHATLRLSRSPFGVLAEVVAEGPLTLDGPEVAPGERPVAQRLPLALVLGDTVLDLSSAADDSSAPDRRRLVIGSLAAVCLVAAMVVAAPVIQLATRSAPATQLILAEAAQAATPAAATDFRQVVAEELSRLSLAQHLTLRIEDANAAVIQGRVPASKWQAWRSFAEWYDLQPGAPVLVQSVSRSDELTSLKPVAMIRLAEPARIHFADGETRAIGDVLQDGWVIDSLDESGMVLKRGDDLTEITF